MNFQSGNPARSVFLFGTASLLAMSLSAQINRSSAPPPSVTAPQTSEVTQQSAPVSQATPTPARARRRRAEEARAEQVRAEQARAAKASAAATPVAPSVPQVLPSLFDKPPQPATVTLNNSTLTIHADNSSLTDILHQVASSSGMEIQGLSQDQRIFGTYGPGDPHSVISSLLDGSGYNVMMLGQTPDGAPRSLTLSPRNNMPVSTAPRPDAVPVRNNDDDSSDDDAQPAPVETPMPPPQQQNEQRTTPNTVRTPQQMMQELQQMHQQQQQQQQEQSQPENSSQPQ